MEKTGMSKVGAALDQILTAPIRNLFALVGIYDPLPRGLAVAALFACYLWIVKPLRVFTDEGEARGWRFMEELSEGGPDEESIFFPWFIEVYVISFLASHLI